MAQLVKRKKEENIPVLSGRLDYNYFAIVRTASNSVVIKKWNLILR